MSLIHKKIISYNMYLYFLGTLLILDQATKYLAFRFFQGPVLITDWFRFFYAKNTGIAFSFPIPLWLVIGASVAAILFLGREMKKGKHIWSYGLICTGAIGNLIDRVMNGYVIDFISFWNFPVFNIADTCISIGVVLFLYESFFKKKV